VKHFGFFRRRGIRIISILSLVSVPPRPPMRSEVMHKVMYVHDTDVLLETSPNKYKLRN